MKRKALVPLILVLILLSVFVASRIFPYIKSIESGMVFKVKEKSEREELLLSFVENKLSNNEGGIKTNYLNNISEGDISKGEEVLSESQGLMMLYYLYRGDKEGFDYTLKFIKGNMLQECGVISWRVNSERASKSSASIDDLRIAKALILANEKWGDLSYKKLAINISKGIEKELVYEGLISDFYDGYSLSKYTTLCYVDLVSLKLLGKLNPTYNEIYNNEKTILKNGYVSDELPLYRKVYSWDDKQYDNEDIDVLLSSIVLLNLAEDGEDISHSITWIKKEMEKEHKIYSLYSLDNKQPINQIESTSIYSNLIQVAVTINDKELYDLCLTRLLELQVLNNNSHIYGAYGEESTLEVYSFDNLNALLALCREFK